MAGCIGRERLCGSMFDCDLFRGSLCGVSRGSAASWTNRASALVEAHQETDLFPAQTHRTGMMMKDAASSTTVRQVLEIEVQTE